MTDYVKALSRIAWRAFCATLRYAMWLVDELFANWLIFFLPATIAWAVYGRVIDAPTLVGGGICVLFQLLRFVDAVTEADARVARISYNRSPLRRDDDGRTWLTRLIRYGVDRSKAVVADEVEAVRAERAAATGEARGGLSEVDP